MVKEAIPVIQKTFEYSKFKFLKENRPPNKGKVARIVKSIEQSDQTPWRPILVDANFNIYDGQHQYLALVKLRQPIYYVQNPDIELKAIALLNAFQTSFGMANYAHFYAKQGLENYIDLLAFSVKNHLSIALSMGALTMKFHDWSDLRYRFKEGTFVITHLEEANVLMDEVSQLRPALVGNVQKDREFYRSYLLMREQVDFQTFRDTVLNKKQKIEPRTTKKEYIREFEDLLNYEKSKNLIRLW